MDFPDDAVSAGLRYRSLAGDVWRAEKLDRSRAATRARPGFAAFGAAPSGNLLQESCWDIEVIPPVGARLELRAIPFVGADTGARGVCFEEATDGKKA